ncbi:MAG TPA: DeoR/GlpR family DNA-binding transcription regulator [Candidatus Acidoferrales bacterium]|nr:DeoR/GlpR family DNA-binding transcription regulator [Candidatus Acidoferrales bacterium]
MTKADGTPLLNEERLRAIADVVKNNGRALVRDLAVHFGTAEITIRRDLDVLCKRGVLKRIHGGALRVESDFNVSEREMRNASEKHAIAEAAAAMVKEGQSIVLGAGSTTTAIARELRERTNLTVITNGIRIAQELVNSDLDVIVTGGTMRKNSYSLVGPLAEQVISHLKADIFFMGVDGIDTHVGLFMQNLLGAQLARVMAQMATRTVVVCDSSKFGKKSLTTIIPIHDVHAVITDRKVPRHEVEALRTAGVEVKLV